MGRVALLAVLLPLGCTRGVIDISGDASGVRYRIEGVSLHVSDTPSGGLVVRADGHELISAAGRLTLDGKDLGVVNRGDTVVLTRDGRVLVNGADRTAP
jgi:hypothetical protein